MDYTGRMFDQGGAVFNVKAYYQTGYTDTQAIQAAIDAAVAPLATGQPPQRGTVLIPPGNYTVSQLELKAGITISGYGAVLSRALPVNGVNQGTRMMQLREAGNGTPAYSGAADSELLTIEGLTLDGRSTQQAGYRGSGVEQQHLLFLAADPSMAGRVRVELRDLVLRNGLADGISLYTNVDAQITNCRVDNCVRSGLAVTGGNTRCQVQNLVTSGAVDPTGIFVQVVTAGYLAGNSAGTRRVEVEADGMELDSRFLVAVDAGSTVLASNVRSGAPFRLIAPASTVRIENSSFTVGLQDSGSRLNEIVNPADVIFQNCTFTVEEPAGTEANRTLAAAHVAWNFGGGTLSGQRLRLVDCVWRVGASIESADTVRAVYTEFDAIDFDNRLLVSGGSIEAGFDTGFMMEQGGTWVIKDVEIGAAQAFWWNALPSSPNTTANIRIERVGLRGVTQYMHIANLDGGNVLEHRDVVLEASQNVLDVSVYGIVGNNYQGSRIIRVSADPTTTSTPGLRGDIARRATPAAGQAYEWVCTGSDKTAATWKLKATLAS